MSKRKSTLRLKMDNTVLIFIILKLLDEGKHGYELNNILKQNDFQMKDGVIYTLLKKMEEDNLISWEWDFKERKSRKVYKRTEEGDAALLILNEQWEKLTDKIRKISNSKIEPETGKAADEIKNSGEKGENSEKNENDRSGDENKEMKRNGKEGGKTDAETKKAPTRPAVNSERNKVLWAIQQINKEGKGAGRRSIYNLLKEQNIQESEMKIRKALETLEREKRISVQKGRGGIQIINPPFK